MAKAKAEWTKRTMPEDQKTRGGDGELRVSSFLLPAISRRSAPIVWANGGSLNLWSCGILERTDC